MAKVIISKEEVRETLTKVMRNPSLGLDATQEQIDQAVEETWDSLTE